MKRNSLIFVLASCLLFIGVQVFGQEKKEREKEQVAKLREELRRVAPSYELDLGALERSMAELERSMHALEHFEMPPMPPFPEIAVLADIPEIHVDIPEIHIPEIIIPEIAPIPPIHIPDIEVNFPAIAAPHFNSDHDFPAIGYSVSAEFRQLTEDEELRVQALQAVARQDDREALNMIEKVLQQDKSAAVRYHAVRLLRGHLEQEKAIDLLADRAQNDPHPGVQKTAIRLLGKSGSPRAVDILQKIIQAK